jgi:mono/diheme cytochrome c family protein
LIRTVLRGAKGTAMPSFRWLPQEELEAVVDYVTLLSYRGELERRLAVEVEELDDDEPLDAGVIADYLRQIHAAWEAAEGHLVVSVTRMPARTEETIAAGKQAFLTKECAKCHGADGRGHTQENVGQDIWGHVTNAADLTSGMYHGGRRPIDIYRRIHAGINGTPMPAFGHALAQEPDTIWHLVHYVQSVAETHKNQPD